MAKNSAAPAYHLNGQLNHLRRAYRRYWNRLGNQLAASVAFFTILSLVPLAMFAFAAVGFTLTVIHPEWFTVVVSFLENNIHAGPLQDQLVAMTERYVYSWRSVGIVALVIALFIGSSWVANMKAAIRGMSRPDFDMVELPHSIVVDYVINIGLVFIVIILAGVTIIATTVGTQLVENLVSWALGSHQKLAIVLLTICSLIISMICATVLFYLIFRFFPEKPLNGAAVWRGSCGAAACFVLIQAGGGELARIFALGKATQVLGPVVVVMLVVNLFAQIVLAWTAWIATADQPAIARRYSKADEPLRHRDDVTMVAQHWELAALDKQRIDRQRHERRRQMIERLRAKTQRLPHSARR